MKVGEFFLLVANGVVQLLNAFPAMLRQFGLQPRAAFICLRKLQQDIGSIGARENLNDTLQKL